MQDFFGSFLLSPDLFLLSVIFLQDYEHHFSRSRLTNEPSDAEEAILKRWVDRQIAHDGCLIQSVENFVYVCQKTSSPKNSRQIKNPFQKILWFWYSARRKARQLAKTDKGTSKIHSVRTTNLLGIIQVINRSCFCIICKNNQEYIIKEAGEKKDSFSNLFLLLTEQIITKAIGVL